MNREAAWQLSIADKDRFAVSKVITTLAWVALLLLTFPGNSTTTGTPYAGEAGEVAIMNIEQQIALVNTIPTNSIYVTCPSLAELPLMLGRPAPCVASYSILDN